MIQGVDNLVGAGYAFSDVMEMSFRQFKLYSEAAIRRQMRTFADSIDAVARGIGGTFGGEKGVQQLNRDLKGLRSYVQNLSNPGPERPGLSGPDQRDELHPGGSDAD